MVDGEVRNTVVLDDSGETMVVSKDGESSNNNSETGIREQDLSTVTGVEEEGGGVEV